MPGMDIRKDDLVRIMTGKDRGKEGRVVRVQPGKGRVMVDGVALAKRHQRTAGRKTSAGTQLQQGGIIDVEMFIDVSNVQLVCGHCHQPTRIGHEIDEDGVKTRVCRKCGAVL